MQYAHYGKADAEQYDEVRQREDAWNIEHRYVAQLLHEHPKVPHLLDAPVGTGRFFSLYPKKALQVTGVDLSVAMLEQARQRLPIQQADAPQIELIQADLLDLSGLPPAQLVISWRFLHLLDPELLTPALRSLTGCLTADGLLVVQAYHPRSNWRRFSGRLLRFFSTHLTGRRATPTTAAWAHIRSFLHSQSKLHASFVASGLQIRSQTRLFASWDFDCWAYSLERA